MMARSQEIELKLAFPAHDPARLAKRLAEIPLLVRGKPTHLHLHNVYFDTPEQMLRQARVALRIRRVGSDAKPSGCRPSKQVTVVIRR